MKKAFLILTLLSLLIQCRPPAKEDPLEDLITLLFLQQLLSPANSCSPRAATTGSDPIFNLQWHLKNTGSFGGIAGFDSNVEPVWNQNITGKDIHVTVVDDGVDFCHEDLQNQVEFNSNIDFTGRLPLHVNGTTSCDRGNACHGTAVAGIATAIRNNGLGGSGTAPGARLSGRNLLLSSSENFAANITTATSRMENIHISNNSWGSPDSKGTYNESLATEGWKTAVQEGITTGREGKGSLFFWAGGNGGRIFRGAQTVISSFNNGLIWVDNSNYDGQANNPSVMAICAIGNTGQQVFYSERGANLLVCGYSEGDNQIRTTTTDISGTAGYNFNTSVANFSTNMTNSYTNQFNGTSAATPNVAGVGALILEANPNLNWREVRWILARSARKVDLGNSDWTTNNAPTRFNISHNYGFGAVDAQAAVDRAKNFTGRFSAQKEVTCTNSTPLSISTDTTATPTFNSNACNVSGSGITAIESVEVTVNYNASTHLGDLDLRIVGPAGTTKTESILNEPHPCLSDLGGGDINQVPCNTTSGTWKFSSLRNMDETADGTWTLRVVDRLTAPVMTPVNYTSGTSTIRITSTTNHNNTGAAISSWSIKIKGR